MKKTLVMYFKALTEPLRNAWPYLLFAFLALMIIAFIMDRNQKPKTLDPTPMADAVASQPEDCSNPITLLGITRDFKTDTSVAKYGFNVAASGSVVWISRFTFSANMKFGSGEIIDQTLCLNGAASKAVLTRYKTLIVARLPEDQVTPGTPNRYILELTIDRADFDPEDLKLSFLQDIPLSLSHEASPLGHWVKADGSTEEIRLNSTLSLP